MSKRVVVLLIVAGVAVFLVWWNWAYVTVWWDARKRAQRLAATGSAFTDPAFSADQGKVDDA